MSGHSILAPSSAARRVACPGSRGLEAQYPEEDTDASREGHAAHWVASELLKTRKDWPTQAPNGESITQEMHDGAAIYIKAVYDILKGRRLDWPSLHIEERVDISTIHPDCWGTPDAWVCDGEDLFIWDYKYGHGFVEVFENWQLIEYAAGILHALAVDDQRIFVHFYIVQPRSYHPDGAVRRWSIRASDLRAHFNILRAAEAAATGERPPLTPSPECKYCTARHACPALQRSALSAVEMSEKSTKHDLTSVQTGNELRILERAAMHLDARITGLRVQALSMIQSGQRVPWYTAAPSVGRQVWKNNGAAIVSMGSLMGYNLAKPVEAITPKQAIALGMDSEIVKSFSEIPRGAMRLIADDGTAARKIFGGE